MTDPRTERLARLIAEYCVELKAGDKVAIMGTVLAQPLAVALYQAALERGALPDVLLQVPETAEMLYRAGSEAQLEHVSPIQRLVTETYDATIGIHSDVNTRSLSGADPARQARAQAARRDLSRITMERAAAGALRWNVCQYPTQAHAQEADMSLREYEDFVYGACRVDEPDPVAAWQERNRQQARLVAWLAGKERVEVQGLHVDLRLSIAGRSFINDSGRRNMPGGEVFTSPVEDSAEGWIEFSFPAIFGGREVENVRLVFARGEVVEAHASKGEEFLIQMLHSDEGAGRLGEFAVGNNYGITRFTKNMLFDEKIGGTIHLALGRGFPQAGSRNASALHWDMLCDMRAGGTIKVDGEPLYDSGLFVI